VVTGRPEPLLSVRRRFWRLVAQGVMPAAAGVLCGVSRNTGREWFAKAGGMCPVSSGEPSGRYLGPAEREEIGVGLARGESLRSIAARIGRPPSTVSREVRRNSASKWPRGYRAGLAQTKAEQRARRPKPAKLAGNARLCHYVQAKLDGADRADPPPPGQRARSARAGGQRSLRWSPQQIAGRLPIDFPDDEGMRISHETIYRALYVQGKGELRRELARCLRTGRTVRKPRRQPDARRPRPVPPPEVMISARPAEVTDRAVSGHWEGDLILGAHQASAVGTLVERTSRFVLLLHLPGPGHGAGQVRDAMRETIMTLPAALRRSLTWDQGIEMVTQHAQVRLETGLEVYFCDPHSPWQRGSNENTNGLLRDYLPKGSDLSVHTPADLAEIADILNRRPRKTHGYRTPAEIMNQLLQSA
jgi:IS30 family transposase